MDEREKQDRLSTNDLLDITIDVIAEKGLAGCTFRTLAEKAGVSTTTFTYRFGDRSTLLSKALKRAYEFGWEDMDLGNLEHPDPVERLLEIGLADLQLREELDPYKRAYAEILVAAPRDPKMMEAIREADEAFLASYSELIGRAQEMGMIDSGLDPYVLSLAIWSVIDGLNINRYAYGDELGSAELDFYFRRAFEGIVGRTVGD